MSSKLRSSDHVIVVSLLVGIILLLILGRIKESSLGTAALRTSLTPVPMSSPPDSEYKRDSGDTAPAENQRRPERPDRAYCVRHDAVGFLAAPEILGELAQVYTNCYPQPSCTNWTDLETIQLDGYINNSDWLWMGPPTASFSEAQQDALIDNAIARASAVTPPGKAIIDINFSQDSITIRGLNEPIYVIYVKTTLARCSQSSSQSSRKGMTWAHAISNAQTGTITVGCVGCEPYEGDTACTQELPLLCIFKPTPAFPLPKGVSNADHYAEWSGGVVATSQPVAGNTFADSAAANSYCSTQFGAGWRVAEFHDGWGWNFQAYGGTVSAPAVPSTRFWVYINDQSANCWPP
jgi:hypothetical protein